MSERAPPPPLALVRSRRRWLPIIGILTALAFGGVFAMVAAAFIRFGGIVLQPESWKTAEIGTASMAPGLLVGDRILADRTAYDEALPERGDVIVFGLPASASWREQIFVLRVVAIPGDRIQMVAGVPVLNGTPLIQEFLGGYADPGRPRLLEATFPGATAQRRVL